MNKYRFLISLFFAPILAVMGMLGEPAEIQPVRKFTPARARSRNKRNGSVDSEPELVQELRKRADAGDSEACFELGARLWEGYGRFFVDGGAVEEDCAGARKFFRRAKELGHPKAQEMIELMDDMNEGQADKEEEKREKVRKIWAEILSDQAKNRRR